MDNTFKKQITGDHSGRFAGTKLAFANLISKSNWYAGIKINGFAVTTNNASSIKRNFNGKSKKGISLDYMENILLAAGYKIAQQIIWEK